MKKCIMLMMILGISIPALGELQDIPPEWGNEGIVTAAWDFETEPLMGEPWTQNNPPDCIEPESGSFMLPIFDPNWEDGILSSSLWYAVEVPAGGDYVTIRVQCQMAGDPPSPPLWYEAQLMNCVPAEVDGCRFYGGEQQTDFEIISNVAIWQRTFARGDFEETIVAAGGFLQGGTFENEGDPILYDGIIVDIIVHDTPEPPEGTPRYSACFVPDTNAPTPDPMSFAQDPCGFSDNAVSMTATTAVDDGPAGVEYSFECTSGGGNDSGWQEDTTYTDTGLTPNTQYCYRVQSRDKSSNQNETGWSTASCATTKPPDLTPPTPDPMTWETSPETNSTRQISMTATTATDPAGVEYYFDETSGNPGGSDSGWQDSVSYTDTGLDVCTEYCYQVKARDKSSNQNETAYSDTACATTKDFRGLVIIGGRVPMSWVFFPDPADASLETYVTGGSVTLQSLEVYELNSIWSPGEFDELYRPQYHLTAPTNWMNDTNGTVYYDGEYHCFYQHNPYGLQWDNMHWGHAVSTDMVHWEHLPIALNMEDHGDGHHIFSGSCVVDSENTAGFKTGSEDVMVAVYTIHNSSGMESQAIAYSNDRGRTFTAYAGNPVIAPQSDKRDPKVFWYEPDSKWVMVLHDQGDIDFYSSPNLKNWTYMSHNSGFHECPDFFELPVDGNPNNKKWVLLDAGNGGYQIGEFNGTTFTPETTHRPFDFGRNYYATQTFNNIPEQDGRRIQMAWMNSDTYPGMPFNQQQSFATEVTLRTFPDGIRLCRAPIREILNIRGEDYTFSNQILEPGENLLSGINHDLIEIVAVYDLTGATATAFGFDLRGALVNYDTVTNQISVSYDGDQTVTDLLPEDNKIAMHILLDRASLEVYANQFQHYEGYSGGDGSAQDPFKIATPNDIEALAENPFQLSSHFILTNDINLADFNYLGTVIASDADNTNPGFDGPGFSGVFDGNDHIISNLNINTEGANNDFLGLFGQIDGGTVKNLRLVDCNITGGEESEFIGGLCGNNTGTISNSGASGSVSGGGYSNLLAGLCGYNEGGTLENCHSQGTVTGGYLLGGLCGVNLGGEIKKCYTSSSVSTSAEVCYELGGLCAENYQGTIENCYSNGSVDAGEFSWKIGGLCGWNYQGTVINSYAAGQTIGGSDTGALIGKDGEGEYTASFWNIDVNPDVNGLGNTTDPNVMGRTTAEMQIKSTFTDYGWDFVGESVNGPNDVWTIKKGVKYPEHVWPIVQFVDWDGVDFRDYSHFSDWWMQVDCNDLDDCNSTDLDYSGTVDFNDLDIFNTYWLFGK